MKGLRHRVWTGPSRAPRPAEVMNQTFAVANRRRQCGRNSRGVSLAGPRIFDQRPDLVGDEVDVDVIDVVDPIVEPEVLEGAEALALVGQVDD